MPYLPPQMEERNDARVRNLTSILSLFRLFSNRVSGYGPQTLQPRGETSSTGGDTRPSVGGSLLQQDLGDNRDPRYECHIDHKAILSASEGAPVQASSEQ